jgi:hypothetical protein
MYLHFRHDTGSHATGSASALKGCVSNPRNGSNAAHFPRLVGPEASAA